MHCDHDIFTQAIKEKRKVKVAFLSDEDGCSQVKLCAPVDFEPCGVIGEESSRYYFWDFEKGTNGAPLILEPNQISSVKLHKETFNPAKFVTWDLEELPWFLERDWDQFS